MSLFNKFVLLQKPVGPLVEYGLVGTVKHFHTHGHIGPFLGQRPDYV